MSLSRADSLKGRLQRAALAGLREHYANDELPTSGRFLFYELSQAGVVGKEMNGRVRTDAQDLADALMRLREHEIVPWSWIVDETRTLHEWEYAETASAYVVGAVKQARIDAWAGEPPPLLLVESRSLGGVLEGLASEYLCPIAATNGQVGGFLRTDVVPLLAENERRVLYLGDHDLAGDQIEANTRRVLVHETGRAIDWRRVAITGEQIAERGLEPIRKRDKRYRPAREHEAWETEALGQRTVMALVRDVLDELLPEPLRDVQVRERQQKESALLRLR